MEDDMAKSELKIKDLSGRTLNVIVTRRFRFRVWVGCKILRVAAAVMGCGVSIETGDDV